MSIKRSTLKKLWAASGNQCGFPDCDENVVNIEQEIVVGEICHIRAQSPGGPRYDPDLSEEEVDEYSNLILLCPTHHTYIDKNTENYPPEKLEEWKKEQQKKSSQVTELSDNLLTKLQLTDLEFTGEIFTESQSDDLREYLQVQTDHTQRLSYIKRQEVPGKLGQKHLIVGPKGSGKSRLLFERAMDRFESGAVQSALVPSRAATRIEDIQAAFSHEFDGDVLLVWDDIHNVDPGDTANLFYETVLKLQEQLSDDQSLHVLATVRSEEVEKLPRYRFWREDRVWSSFNRTTLAPLDSSTAKSFIENGITEYELTLSDAAHQQFETLVEFESPTPFYIEAACSYLAEEVDGEVTRGNIVDLPTHGVEIWTEQYRRLVDKDPDARFVLLSLKLLHRISEVKRVSVIRGIFVNVFEREPVDFDGAIRRLREQRWITEIGDDPELKTHGIQIEAIEDSIEYYISQLAEYLLSDLAKSNPDEATGLAINLALEIFVDPSFSDETIVDEISARILSGDIIKRISPEVEWLLYNNYAGVLATRGELEEALKQTTQAIQILPKNPVGYINHQKIAEQLGENTIAQNSLQRAVELAANEEQISQPWVRAQLAEYLHRQGDSEQARNEFQTALTNSDDDPLIAQRFADFCEDLNQIGSARQLHMMAAEQTNSISVHLQYAMFLGKHGPEDTFEEVRERILKATSEEIRTLSEAFEKDQAYKLQWTEKGHNSPLITDLPEYQLLEQARDRSEVDGPAEAAAWLEPQLSDDPPLPVFDQLVEFYFEAEQLEDVYRIFSEFLPDMAKEYSPSKVSESVIRGIYELEAAGAGERGIELAKFAADQFRTENEQNRQAQAMILRHMAKLDAFDPMHSLMLPYRLGKSHIFYGDIENALNTFFDTWEARDGLSEDEADIGIEYGVKAGCVILALINLMEKLDGELTGGSFPVHEINEFVSENISISPEEFQQLYAEIQLQQNENDPLYQREDLPEPQRMYPDQVDLDEDTEEPIIRKEDIALTNTLRAYLQIDPDDILL